MTPFIMCEALDSPGCTRALTTTPFRARSASGSQAKLVIVNKSQLLPVKIILNVKMKKK